MIPGSGTAERALTLIEQYFLFIIIAHYSINELNARIFFNRTAAASCFFNSISGRKEEINKEDPQTFGPPDRRRDGEPGRAQQRRRRCRSAAVAPEMDAAHLHERALPIDTSQT